jgi:hypothetical protein
MIRFLAFTALWVSSLIVLGFLAKLSWLLLSVGWGFF